MHALKLRKHAKGRLPLTRPSYAYAWNDLDPQTFHTLGLIARRAPDGTPRFNLPQTVWFDADDFMDWSDEPSSSVFTLAVNVLTPFASRLDLRGYFGATSRRILSVAPGFAETWLFTMASFGGRIPIEIIREWVSERP